MVKMVNEKQQNRVLIGGLYFFKDDLQVVG